MSAPRNTQGSNRHKPKSYSLRVDGIGEAEILALHISFGQIFAGMQSMHVALVGVLASETIYHLPVRPSTC